MAEPRILRLDDIKPALDLDGLLGDMERAFVAHSRGESVVPPVGYLAFDAPVSGDVHIKYGYVRGDEFYVVKVASGFAGKSDGMMLLFRQGSGELAAILLDKGYLTDIRTAVAGAITVKHLGPTRVTRIGVLGSGVQARFQLRLISRVTGCREAAVWARRRERAEAIRDEIAREGLVIEVAESPRDLAARCNVIVTCTSAREPVLRLGEVRPGTHITAMGADAPGKQELDAALVVAADVLVADSREQCLDHGELAHARSESGRVVELGEVIAGGRRGREGEGDITIADLTGVAVQDIAIATHVWRRWEGGRIG